MTFPHISRSILALSVGFISGVGLRSFFMVPYDVVLFLVSICVLMCIFIFYKRQNSWALVIFFLGAIHGVTVMHDHMQFIDNQKNMIGQQIIGNAVVERDIIQKQWYAEVYARYIDQDITVLIKDEKYPRVIQGNKIALSCTPMLPEKVDDFDYRMYLAMQGVYFICEDHTYEIIGEDPSMGTRIGVLRHTWEQIINQTIPSPQAALANGLIFGGDDRLSKELQLQFSRTGMTHVVAVSGYNVSIIITAIMSIVIFCGAYRKMAVVIAIIGVVAFVFLIGFPSSAVRAAIMGIIVLVAATFGRVSYAYSGICFTAALMLIHNPLLLRYDIGFQLSFLATIGIVATHNFFTSVIPMRKDAFGLVEIIALTMSAQIFVLPIIAYYFHTFSTLSIIANVLILPIIPFTMLLIVLLIVFSYLFMPIAIVCGWCAYFLLTYEIFVIRYFAQISWGSVSVMRMETWWILLYYIFLFFGIYYLQKKYERKKDCDL